MPVPADRITKAITLVPTYHTRNAPTAVISMAVTSVRTIAAINVQAVMNPVRSAIKAVPREPAAISLRDTNTGHYWDRLSPESQGVDIKA